MPNNNKLKPGTRIALGERNCRDQKYVFTWTGRRSIKHVISGMCVALKGKKLVLRKRCDRGRNVRFKYVAKRKRLVCSGKTVQTAQGGNYKRGTKLIAKRGSSAGNKGIFTLQSKL